MQTVFITGANGFVVRYLVECLLPLGYRVIATGRGEARLQLEHKNLQYLSLEITDKNAISKTMESFKPGVGWYMRPPENAGKAGTTFLLW